ncbi:aminotransferase class V-fold PLP-dependent enzyme [Streptomyces spiramenti]|uniref:Aminotransferase class V-fold PLP-dependent enzyme n=1 Tax=Streptomyces spiramenti TaxID=2720606 RepID=A0ABX1ALS6_9ACTN|nr:aminotransferase class V-fold PLP-dependent enzyme [Streptomyces spiramenti]
MTYFDAASSAPPHPVAREAFLAAWEEGWADPARLHREGRRARLLLDAAREGTAELLDCRPDELAFTTSGTRALHTGIAGTLAARHRVGRRLLHSAVEHSAVLHAAESHRGAGGTAVEVPPDRAGRTAVADWSGALTPDTALAVLQSANHEVGTEQPVEEVAEVCGAAGVPLLVDAAQSVPWGEVPGRWSLLTASAHKWGGPGGVGLLVVRKGTRFAPPEPHDERESGRSPGFPSLPAVVAAAASLRAVRAEATAEAERLRALVRRIRTRVPEEVPDTWVVGHPELRLPNVVTFSCLYADGEALLDGLDREGFAVSSGSSCTSSTLTPSHVLRAMGVLSEGNVRVSLPRGTAESDVERFLAALPRVVGAVRDRLAGPVVPDGPGGTAEPDDTAEPDCPAGGSAAGATPAGVTEVEVDALGRRCPIPVIELAKVLPGVPVGAVVRVLADDSAARLDIPAWCEMRGQEYLGEEPLAGPGRGGSAYRVRRTG